MSSDEEPQSVETVSLLYPNATKRVVSLADFCPTPDSEPPFSDIRNVSIRALIILIFETWDANIYGADPPESVYQIRLIQLGKPLEDGVSFDAFEEWWAKGEIDPDATYNYAADNEGIKLGDLKLEISNVIHVSLRPLDSLKKIKTKNNPAGKLITRVSTSGRSSKAVVTANDEINDQNSGGGCCVIT